MKKIIKNHSKNNKISKNISNIKNNYLNNPNSNKISLEKSITKKNDPVLLLESVLITSFIFLLTFGITSLLNLNIFQDQTYFSLWSKLMMPSIGFPSIFLILIIVFSLIISFIITTLYKLVKNSIKTKSKFLESFIFAMIVYFIIFFQNNFLIFLLFNIPIKILIIWNFSGFLFSIIAGLMIILINNKK